MNTYSLAIRFFGRFNNFLAQQIALCGLSLSNVNGFVGQFHVQRVAVSIGEHAYTLNAESISCPDNAASDFTSVRDQQFAKRHFFSTSKQGDSVDANKNQY